MRGLTVGSRYNQLKEDTEQPEVSEDHIQKLAEIFVRYNVEAKFGIHLIHGHFKLEPDTVMLGRHVQKPYGCWTKPCHINDVKLDDIHGHIFALNSVGNFIAYEYREGPPFNMVDVDSEFLRELIEYIQSNKLEGLFGLEVLREGSQEQFAEFDLGKDGGTIMLKASEANYGRIYRITGWSFEEADGIVSCSGGTVHAAKKDGNHQVFVDSKPLRGVPELRMALEEAKII